MLKKKILIVDDSPEVRTELSAILMNLGFEVHTAASGNEALGFKISHNMIISDILMPDGSGIDYLLQLRAIGDQTPFFFYSEAMTITKETATLLGANDCYHKSELSKLLREALKVVIVSDDQNFFKHSSSAFKLNSSNLEH